MSATDPLSAVVVQIINRLRALESNTRAEVAGGVQALLFVDLPAAGQAGRVRFCTNCRKVGEGAGVGTGIAVYDDGGAVWRRFSDDTPAAV